MYLAIPAVKTPSRLKQLKDIISVAKYIWIIKTPQKVFKSKGETGSSNLHVDSEHPVSNLITLFAFVNTSVSQFKA